MLSQLIRKRNYQTFGTRVLNSLLSLLSLMYIQIYIINMATKLHFSQQLLNTQWYIFTNIQSRKREMVPILDPVALHSSAGYINRSQCIGHVHFKKINSQCRTMYCLILKKDGPNIGQCSTPFFKIQENVLFFHDVQSTKRWF